MGGDVRGSGKVGVLGETEIVIRAEGADRAAGMDGVAARGSFETGQGAQPVAAGELGQIVVERRKRRHGPDSRSGSAACPASERFTWNVRARSPNDRDGMTTG